MRHTSWLMMLSSHRSPACLCMRARGADADPGMMVSAMQCLIMVVYFCHVPMDVEAAQWRTMPHERLARPCNAGTEGRGTLSVIVPMAAACLDAAQLHGNVNYAEWDENGKVCRVCALVGRGKPEHWRFVHHEATISFAGESVPGLRVVTTTTGHPVFSTMTPRAVTSVPMQQKKQHLGTRLSPKKEYARHKHQHPSLQRTRGDGSLHGDGDGGASDDDVVAVTRSKASISCPAGKYRPHFRRLCAYCPAGKFKFYTRDVECTSCPVGKFSYPGSTSCPACVQCRKGSYRVGCGEKIGTKRAGACFCPAGRFRGASSTPSAALTTFRALPPSSPPSACPACALGQYSARASSARACRPCVDCDPLSHMVRVGCNATVGPGRCECAGGRFAHATASDFRCLRCPLGRFREPPHPFKFDASGQLQSQSDAGPRACRPCANCGHGKGSQPGSGSGAQLVPSSCGGALGPGHCTCMAGRYDANEYLWKTLPKDLPKLMHKTKLELELELAWGKSGRALRCIGCPQGKYRTHAMLESGLLQCRPCRQCEAKELVMACHGEQGPGRCRPACAAGRFMHTDSVTGGEACWPCPPGKYQPVKYQPYCGTCALGQYQPKAGATACIATPAPTPVPTAQPTAAPTLAPTPPPSPRCAAGEWDALQPEAAKRMGIGAAQMLTLTAPCQPCPAGRAGTDGVLCEKCAPGRYALASAARCRPCARGRFGVGGSTDASCNGPCPAGRLCAEGTYPVRHIEREQQKRPNVVAAGAIVGIAAPPGRFTLQGSSAAYLCAAGRYGVGGCARAECSGACVAGRWGRPGEDTAQCSGACRAGYFGGGGSAEATCDGACGSGQYSNEGAAQCKGCARGQFQPQTGQTHCKGCPSGRFAPARGAAACAACPSGRRSVPGTKQRTRCVTAAPTALPTAAPTLAPSSAPTPLPSPPTSRPTPVPTLSPTASPTLLPTPAPSPSPTPPTPPPTLRRTSPPLSPSPAPPTPPPTPAPPLCLQMWLESSHDNPLPSIAAGCMGSFRLAPDLSTGSVASADDVAMARTPVWRRDNVGGQCGNHPARSTPMYLYLNRRFGTADWVVSAACPQKAGIADARDSVVLGCPPFILAASVPPGAPSGAWAAPDQLPFLSKTLGHGWAMPDTVHTIDLNANYGQGPRKVPSLHAICLRRGAVSSLNAMVPTRPPYWRIPRGCVGGGCARRRRQVLVADASKSMVAQVQLHKQHMLLSSVTCEEMVLSGQAPGEPHDGCMGSYRVLKPQKRQWQPVLQFDGNPLWVLDSTATATRCAGVASDATSLVRKSSTMNGHGNARSVSAVVVALFFQRQWGMWITGVANITIEDSLDPSVKLDLAAVVFDAVSESSTPDKVPAGSWFASGRTGAATIPAPHLRITCGPPPTPVPTHVRQSATGAPSPPPTDVDAKGRVYVATDVESASQNDVNAQLRTKVQEVQSSLAVAAVVATILAAAGVMLWRRRSSRHHSVANGMKQSTRASKSMKGDDEYLDIGDTLDNIGLENLVLNDAREVELGHEPTSSSGSRAIEMAGVSDNGAWTSSVYKRQDEIDANQSSSHGSGSVVEQRPLLKAHNPSSSSLQPQHTAVLRSEFVTKFDDDNDSI